MKCCICGLFIRGDGNNPGGAGYLNDAKKFVTFDFGESDKCCNTCNTFYVIPGRLYRMTNHTDAVVDQRREQRVVNKEVFDKKRSTLLDTLIDRYCDTYGVRSTIKWLLDEGFTPDELIACLDFDEEDVDYMLFSKLD